MKTTRQTGKRAALYARVSTDGQTCENQLQLLREVASRSGWTIVAEYVDHGIRGAKGREQRPQYDKLLKDATRREFDLVAAWSVDRLGRSLKHLVHFLDELHALGIDLFLHQQGIDTTTPAGQAMFQMLDVFSAFERAMIVERVQAGLQRARAQGKQLGRPRIEAHLEAAIRAHRLDGMSMNRIAQTVGVGKGTVLRVLNSQ